MLYNLCKRESCPGSKWGASRHLQLHKNTQTRAIIDNFYQSKISKRILLNFNTNICTKQYYRLPKPPHCCFLPPRNEMNMVITVLAPGNIIAFKYMVVANKRKKLPSSIGNSGGRISFKPPILTDYSKWTRRHGDEVLHLFRQDSCMCYYIG